MAKRVVEAESATLEQVLAGDVVDDGGGSAERVRTQPAEGVPAEVAPAAPKAGADPAAAADPSPVPHAAAAPPAAPAAPAAPEPEDEPDEEYRDPEWIEHLPKDQREAARATLKGQRIAVTKQRNRRLEAERLASERETERRQAVQIALSRDEAMRTQGQRLTELEEFQRRHAPSGAPATTPGAKSDGFVTLGELQADGTVRVSQAELDAYLARAAQPQREQEQQQRQAVEWTQRSVAEVDRVVTEAGVSVETQKKLGEAFKDMSQMLLTAARRAGLTPTNIPANFDELAFMRQSGVEAQLQAKFPGVSLDHIYALGEAFKNPFQLSSRYALANIAQHYEKAWGKPAAPPPPAAPKEPPRLRDHPAPLGRSGGTDTHVDSTVDEIVGLKPEDVINGKLSKEKADELVDRWRRETRH